jgi:hypothetical protein
LLLHSWRTLIIRTRVAGAGISDYWPDGALELAEFGRELIDALRRLPPQRSHTFILLHKHICHIRERDLHLALVEIAELFNKFVWLFILPYSRADLPFPFDCCIPPLLTTTDSYHFLSQLASLLCQLLSHKTKSHPVWCCWNHWNHLLFEGKSNSRGAWLPSGISQESAGRILASMHLNHSLSWSVADFNSLLLFNCRMIASLINYFKLPSSFDSLIDKCPIFICLLRTEDSPMPTLCLPLRPLACPCTTGQLWFCSEFQLLFKSGRISSGTRTAFCSLPVSSSPIICL